jgi:hypothetical protein
MILELLNHADHSRWVSVRFGDDIFILPILLAHKRAHGPLSPYPGNVAQDHREMTSSIRGYSRPSTRTKTAEAENRSNFVSHSDLGPDVATILFAAVHRYSSRVAHIWSAVIPDHLSF